MDLIFYMERKEVIGELQHEINGISLLGEIVIVVDDEFEGFCCGILGNYRELGFIAFLDKL